MNRYKNTLPERASRIDQPSRTQDAGSAEHAFIFEHLSKLGKTFCVGFSENFERKHTVSALHRRVAKKEWYRFPVNIQLKFSYLGKMRNTL